MQIGESQNPQLEKIQSKNKKMELFSPKYLREQINLPRSRWDEDFKKLIEEKEKENQDEKINGITESSDVLLERTFKRYMNGLGLDERALKDKKVLDLGSGDGEFVRLLIERGITSDAYGIDAQLEKDTIENKFEGHFIEGNFEEDLPIKNNNYIVSVGAVSNGIWGDEEVMDIKRIIEKSFDSLKRGGEMRIYPIQEVAYATPLEGLQESIKKWGELLKEISETRGIEYKIEPRDIRVVGRNNDIILESVLIMKKRIMVSKPHTPPPNAEFFFPNPYILTI